MSPTNGCHNKPRPTADSSYLVQDGYYDSTLPDGTLVRGGTKWKLIKVFSAFLGCMYDASARDRRCDGCAHAPHLRGPA